MSHKALKIVMPLLGTDVELSSGPGGYPVPQHQDLQIRSKDDHLDSEPKELPHAPSYFWRRWWGWRSQWNAGSMEWAEAGRWTNDGTCPTEKASGMPAWGQEELCHQDHGSLLDPKSLHSIGDPTSSFDEGFFYSWRPPGAIARSADQTIFFNDDHEGEDSQLPKESPRAHNDFKDDGPSISLHGSRDDESSSSLETTRAKSKPEVSSLKLDDLWHLNHEGKILLSLCLVVFSLSNRMIFSFRFLPHLTSLCMQWFIITSCFPFILPSILHSHQSKKIL